MLRSACAFVVKPKCSGHCELSLLKITHHHHHHHRHRRHHHRHRQLVNTDVKEAIVRRGAAGGPLTIISSSSRTTSWLRRRRRRVAAADLDTSEPLACCYCCWPTRRSEVVSSGAPKCVLCRLVSSRTVGAGPKPLDCFTRGCAGRRHCPRPASATASACPPADCGTCLGNSSCRFLGAKSRYFCWGTGGSSGMRGRRSARSDGHSWAQSGVPAM